MHFVRAADRLHVFSAFRKSPLVKKRRNGWLQFTISPLDAAKFHKLDLQALIQWLDFEMCAYNLFTCVTGICLIYASLFFKICLWVLKEEKLASLKF